MLKEMLDLIPLVQYSAEGRYVNEGLRRRRVRLPGDNEASTRIRVLEERGKCRAVTDIDARNTGRRVTNPVGLVELG